MSFSLPGIPQNSTLGEDLAILVQVAQDLRSARVRILILMCLSSFGHYPCSSMWMVNRRVHVK